MSSPTYEQSAVIPYRRDANGEIQIALITSVSGKRWVVPKGLIDPGESAVESAERECEEEAGLVGAVSDEPIGRFQYNKWGGVCDVDVFLMRVEEQHEHWDESDVRERQWFSIEQAVENVREEDLKEIILQLPDSIHDTRGSQS